MAEPLGLDRWRGPEYARLFAAARRALEKQSPAVPDAALSGRVSVGEPDEKERRALIGITGRHQMAGVKRMTVDLAELDAVLRSSAGLSLVQVLERVQGRPLRYRCVERAELDAARTALLEQARSSPLYEECEWYRGWLAGLDGAALTRLVNQGAQQRLDDAVRVLESVERNAGAAPLLLPVLAERATGDTKALSGGSALAALVLGALAVREGEAPPRRAEQERALWDACGVVADDLASRVLVLNLPARGAGLGEWLTSAAGYGTPLQVTLHQLAAHPISVHVFEVFICENPAVLRRAAGELGPACPPLLCTEGRPSTAFHRLARILTVAGARLRYHGDYDWPGLSIADQVIRAHGARPWLMEQGQYRRHARPGEHALPLRGKAVPAEWSPGLSAALVELGIAVYEEAVADELLADLGRAGAR